MNSKQIKAPVDKAGRIIWKSDEWLNFTATFLKNYPSRDPLSAKFHLRKDEFATTQKLAVGPDRQRPIHNDVLMKATVRIVKIIKEFGAESLTTSSEITENMWSIQDYVAVANQLHLLRTDLNLLFATTPRGFTAGDLEEAQSVLPESKRRKIENVEIFVEPLKRAYQVIKVGHPTTTITKITPQLEQVVTEVSDNAVSSKIRWVEADLRLIAKEILRRNSASNYLSDETLASLSPKEVFECQREALAMSRRRDRTSISQTIKTIRRNLLDTFKTMRTSPTSEVTRDRFTPAANKTKSVSRVFNGLAKSPPAAERSASSVERPVQVNHEPVAPNAVAITSLADQASHEAVTVDAILNAARPFVSLLIGEVARSLASTLAPQIAAILMKGDLATAIATAFAANVPLVGAQVATQPTVVVSNPDIEQSGVPESSPTAAQAGIAAGPAAAPSQQGTANPGIDGGATVSEEDDDRRKDAGPNGNIAAANVEHVEDADDDTNLPNGNVALPVSASRPDLDEEFTAEDEAFLKMPDAHQSKLIETRITKTIADTGHKTKIGVLGVKGSHEAELQHMYPDVHFLCQDSQSKHSIATLETCHRVLAQKGFVAPMPNSFLTKKMPDRYIVCENFAMIKSEIATILRTIDQQYARAA